MAAAVTTPLSQSWVQSLPSAQETLPLPDAIDQEDSVSGAEKKI